MGYTHGKKFRKKFGSEQRVIGGPEFGGSRNEALIVDSKLLGDFRARDNFVKNLIPFRVGSLGVEISFYLGRGEGSEDEGDGLAFYEIEVNGCRKTQMAFFCQVQELYVDNRSGNTVDNALSDVPEVEGEVLGDKESLVVRLCLVETARNGTVWKDVGVVLITSIVECGCGFSSEGEDTPDYLNERDHDRERGSAGCGETED